MWSKVSFLRKQHDGRDQASKYRPSDLKSTRSPLHDSLRQQKSYPGFVFTRPFRAGENNAGKRRLLSQAKYMTSPPFLCIRTP